MKRISIAVLWVLGVLALTIALATPAHAGNGTSNFYLSGKCGIDYGAGKWAELNVTNYDNGANQTYHWSVRRSGTGIRVISIALNGVTKSSGSTEGYISASGHNRNTIRLTIGDILGSAYKGCSVTL